MTVHVPSFLDMWDSAQIVIVCNLPEIEEKEPRTDITSPHPELNYYTSEMVFNIDGERDFLNEAVIKGSLLPNETEYLQEELNLYFQATTSEIREEKREIPEGHVFGFGTAGFLREPPDGANRCLVFLNRDISGRLEPIHPQYYVYYLTRSVEYKPIKP